MAEKTVWHFLRDGEDLFVVRSERGLFELRRNSPDPLNAHPALHYAESLLQELGALAEGDLLAGWRSIEPPSIAADLRTPEPGAVEGAEIVITETECGDRSTTLADLDRMILAGERLRGYMEGLARAEEILRGKP